MAFYREQWTGGVGAGWGGGGGGNWSGGYRTRRKIRQHPEIGTTQLLEVKKQTNKQKTKTAPSEDRTSAVQHWWYVRSVRAPRLLPTELLAPSV